MKLVSTFSPTTVVSDNTLTRELKNSKTMMELEEFGDSVEQLEDYCHRAGLGRVIIKESLHYGSTEVMVKVGNKQVVATAKSASSGREKAALLWLDRFAPRSGASSPGEPLQVSQASADQTRVKHQL